MSSRAFAGSTLTPQGKRIVANWLKHNPIFRQATDADCDCAEDITQIKEGSEQFNPIPDYHPYIATGDFNGDGFQDFAIVVINRKIRKVNFELLIFNGPISSSTVSPSFVETGLDLKFCGLIFGTDSHRLTIKRLESERTLTYVPVKNTYISTGDLTP
jgi:hypothetical protein